MTASRRNGTAKPGKPIQPLDHMLAVMRDPAADPARRDRMAIAAAQYCHQRAVDTRRSKKSQDAEAAKRAGDGTGWEGLLDWKQN
jgi:phage terminase small subunit